MKVVVIGGSGLIGSKLIAKLAEQGHEAVPASPKSGVNTLTGEGLAQVLAGAAVVVDVSNSPSFEATAVMEFFVTSTRNLLAQEAVAGVCHHVALSVVGTNLPPQNAYFRAKDAQEKLIQASAIPFTIVRATQFFEFVKSIADFSTDGDTVRVPAALIQPIVSDEVAAALARVAVAAPVNGLVEIAGPEVFTFEELVRLSLNSRNEARRIITDPKAGYFGAPVSERTLVPIEGASLGETRFADWLSRQSPTKDDGSAERGRA